MPVEEMDVRFAFPVTKAGAGPSAGRAPFLTVDAIGGAEFTF